MNRDSTRKLSDSDFWQICHEMHPTTNYTFPVAPMLGVANNDNFMSNDLENLNRRLDFEPHETSEDVSSDDSLQNLYVKKQRDHRKLLNAHSNCVNTKKILDTIDLFSDEENDNERVENGVNGKNGNNNESNDKHEFKLDRFESNDIDTIQNTDELLLKIADSVQQLKTNVNQLNDKCQASSMDAKVAPTPTIGDLIDFSDDWTNGESKNENSDKPIKKVTHLYDQGSFNDSVDNEGLPYVKIEQQKNLLNNNTGIAALSNEIEYDGKMEANNHRNDIQVNYCNEWHTENGNDYPSPTTSESSNNSSSSSCSYTDSLSNSSGSTTSDNKNIETEIETNDGHTCTNSNSQKLNTEHNRRSYEFEQCAHQTQPNSKITNTKFNVNGKCQIHPLGCQLNCTAANVATISYAKINIETNNKIEDSSNGACAVHTFVTFTHTIRDNNEVDSSIEPKTQQFGVEKASQDVLTTSSSAQQQHTSNDNDSKTIRIECANVVAQPKPSAITSSFIEPLPLDTSTSADSVGLQAEWDADKNNNPSQYKDKRTKALPHSINSEVIHEKPINFKHFSIAHNSNIVNKIVYEKFVPILCEHIEKKPNKIKQNLSSASAASTPFDADNQDKTQPIAASVNTKICLRTKSTKCKLKYRRNVVECRCKSNSNIYLRKTNNFYQKCNKRRGGNEHKCRTQAENCSTKRRKKYDKRKNRIGKQVRCNCKWKCCRGHLCDYDLCETYLVTSKCGQSKSNNKPFTKVLSIAKKRESSCGDVANNNNSENFVRKSEKIETTVSDDRSADGKISLSQSIRRSSRCKESTCDTVTVTLPNSSTSSTTTSTVYDATAIETVSTTLACDTHQSLKSINETLCIDSANKIKDDEDDDNNNRDCNSLITTAVSELSASDVLADDADVFTKTLEISPSIEKIKQVLSAVKQCCDTDLSVINCDGNNHCAENATKPTNCNNICSAENLTLNVNSLKNSLKLSESCDSVFSDSIFTLKRSASTSSSLSLLSLNSGEPFEASNRLRRLEERFKDFSITSSNKKGRCANNNNLSQSSTIASQQRQQRPNQIQLNFDSKGHSDASTEQQQQQQQFIDALPSIESPSKSVIDKKFAEPKGLHVNDGVVSNENENNQCSDGNNNHIKLKRNPNEKLIETETKHICCTHTIRKRKQSDEHSENTKKQHIYINCELNRVELPFDVEKLLNNSIFILPTTAQRSSTSDNGLSDSIDAQQQKANEVVITDYGEDEDESSSTTAQSFTAFESQPSSLKKDSTKHRNQQIHVANDIEVDDDKLNSNHKSSTNTLTNSDDQLQKINTDEKNDYTGQQSESIINFDDNRNNLEQIFDDKNLSNEINQKEIEIVDASELEITEEKRDEAEEEAEESSTSNSNEVTERNRTETEVQQLDNIANRLINCTPVSISTESEEICHLFSENQRPAIDSPFIYQDEELKTNCIFDVRQLSGFHLPPFDHIYECYDELEDDVDDSDVPIYDLKVNLSKDILNNNDNNDAKLTNCDPKQLNFPSNYCQCTIESIVPLYPEENYRPTSKTNKTAAIMRDMTTSGTLRGLLKKPNRPPPSQKNRVIFDETRNEFFDADYIILVRDDCPYDEEDEEPCTCGEHELVRLCCDEGCQCSAYTDDGRTPQSPKYAPPLEFVDQAALSPPEGYKDGGLQQALGGVLGGHIFGAQHIQQLQVIQRLQAKRAAMLAAQRANNNGTNQSGSSKNHAVPPPPPLSQTICTECAECTECAAKQEHDEALPHMALLSIQATSPERRFTQKEIIAGEERPKYLLNKQHQDSVSSGSNVTPAATATPATPAPTTLAGTDKSIDDGQKSTAGNEPRSTYLNSDISLKPTSISAQITGILKGGKLWKNDIVQSDETTSSATSDDEISKRSVRFIDGGNTKSENSSEPDQDACDGESGLGSGSVTTTETDVESDSMMKQSTLFHNSLRPNSALRQLFPTAVLNTNTQPTQALTHEALRAFDESKRSQLKSSIVHSDSETDTIRRTIERNALRRSLIKYEPKKKTTKPNTSLEERIRQLTCDVDEPPNENATTRNDGRKQLERRSSPTGEENPQSKVTKYVPDKSFSPISTASSSSNSSISAYKRITDIFHKEKRQERIPEADENPIVILPQQLQQDCRCPSAPDLGMGSHLPNSNNQLQAVRPSDSRRQFLSTLAPLTACVAGQRDDMSFYSLAAGDRNSTGSSRCSEYSIGDIDAILQNDDAKKVAPDVIAGTPGQEQHDELAAFAQQDASRTERIRKRYNQETSTTTSVPTSNAGSDDDDEQNDYGFNHRPSVRGIKPRSNEEMLQEMQTQLSSSSVSKPPPLLPRKSGQSNTLPKANTQSLQSKLLQQQQQHHQQQQQQIQMQQQPQTQQQIASIVHQQNISTWNAYYQEQAQRNSLPANTPATYFQHLPIHAARHSFHQEESTIYQNCQGVAMEQHYGQTIAARSPTRRPESPPPLRNYHQTMVLIPYNTDTYAHFAADQIAAQQFQHQNILEYQQVTQQTIRVPIGYPLPAGMQLHVVTGNANQPTYAQYATTTRQQTQMNAANHPTYGYIQDQVPAAVKYTERGAPEGAAASVSQSDCSLISNSVPGTVTSTANNTQTSNTSTTAQQGAVFYAMNV